MEAILEQSRVNCMPQRMFIGTEQEYDRYRKKRKYSPVRIKVIEEVSEEDFVINREEREKIKLSITALQQKAQKNGLTQEILNDILNEES